MSDGGMTPSQFQILREDFQNMRLEFQTAIRELVTREAFTDERRRVDGRFREQADDISELKTQLTQEAQARVQQAAAEAQAKITDGKEREKVRRQTAWQWFALAASLILSPVVAIVVSTLAASIGGK